MQTQMDTDFGVLIRQHRRAAGLSQGELAKRAEIAQKSLGEIERGNVLAPHPDSIKRIADALQLTPRQRACIFDAIGPVQRPATPAGNFSTDGLLSAGRAALLGREREVTEIKDALARDDMRLLTLTGSGGVGKTSLALSIANDLHTSFRDGAVVVSLASVSDSAQVLPTIARTLKLRETANIAATLAEALRRQHLLLVLDNMEQVTDAAPAIAELVWACPRLKVLATSRALLGVYGERSIAISPLPLPHSNTPEDVRQSPAVQLFVVRTRAACPDFGLTDDNAADIALLCRRIDGLPLALELAAAQAMILLPGEIVSRLDDGVLTLTSDMHGRPFRQRSLDDTILWSYELLDPSEQALLRRLSVFEDGCTVEAAETVCGDLTIDVFAGLTALANKSLLTVRHPLKGQPRVQMLDTIRRFAMGRLQHMGEDAEAMRQHTAWVLSLVETWEAATDGHSVDRWLLAIDADYANVHAVLQRAADAGDPILGLTIAGILGFYWVVYDQFHEAIRWLKAFFAYAPDVPFSIPSRIEARARLSLGGLGIMVASPVEMQAHLERGLELATLVQDLRLMARAYHSLAWVEINHRGDLDAAIEMVSRSADLARTAGDTRHLVTALRHLGLIRHRQGDGAHASDCVAESIELSRANSDMRSLGCGLMTLAQFAAEQGNDHGAERLYSQVLDLKYAVVDRTLLAETQIGLGLIALRRGDPDRAQELCEQSLAHMRAIGLAEGVVVNLSILGAIALRDGRAPAAALYFGEAIRYYPMLPALPQMVLCLDGIAGVLCGRGEYERAARSWGIARDVEETLHDRQASSLEQILPGQSRSETSSRLAAALGPTFEDIVAQVRTLAPEDRFALARNEARLLEVQVKDDGAWM